MLQSVFYRGLELFILFVLIPVSFALPYHPALKAGVGFLGFVYICWVLLKVERLPFRPRKNLPWKSFWRRTLLVFLGILIFSVIYVYWVNPKMLFYVPLNNPGLYVLIFFVYSLLSVYPQELLYRTFFFQRYELLFQNKKILILINAALFSLAHLFFRNALVMLLTFLGGLLFAFTFVKTRSTILVTIEHIIYGIWLYTVGMGEMLAFPSEM